MNIGIDATCWWNQRGFGRFTRGLLTAMFAAPRGHKFCLFVDRPAAPEMQGSNVQIVQVPVARTVTQSAVAEGRRSLRDVWAFRRAVADEPIDLMFFPAVYSWFPVRARVKTAVTLHDAIAEHFPHLIFPNWKGRLFWSLKMRLACSRAHRIITVSHAAKEEIVEHIGIRPGMIDVICEGADSQFQPVTDLDQRASARQRALLPPGERLILYVGAIAPHKNLSNLLNGFLQAISHPGMEDIHLALVGDPAGDGFYSNYDALVSQVNAEARLQGRVHFTGFIGDDDLPALYSEAVATILPSVSEGFGLSALESMACGTPVLTSNVGGAPEVVGSAGLTFDAFDPAQIARQIYRIANEPATLASLRERALGQARQYSWNKAAELTFASLQRCMGTG